jgi:ankyrin repeat protein
MLWMHAHSHSAAEAQDSLAQLHASVERILQSNHAISIQLRELIAQRSLNDDAAPDTVEAIPVDANHSTDATHVAEREHPHRSPASPEFQPTSPSVTPSSAVSRRTSIFDNSDAASTRTTTSTFSMRSVRSLVPSFRDALENSRVYKRVHRRGRDSESIFTLESSERGCNWSMLSDLSLGELSIAEIWVIELPICLSDLWDPEPFRVDSTVSAPRRSSSRLNWSSRGRIHNAIVSGNEYVVRTLLSMGSDIEEANREGATPLALALLKNRDVIARLLLAKGASIDIAAAKAFEGGNEAVLRLMLARGASVEARDDQGRTFLMRAVVWGHTNLVKVLLEMGADVGACDAQGRTPLALTAIGGQEAVAKLLLEKGANVESRDNEGRTPLAQAVLYEHESIVKLLLDKGASVDALKAIGMTADLNGRLKSAIREGKETVVRMLLSMGADVEERDSQSRTPLAEAVLYKHESIVKLLLEKGASVDALKAIGTTTDLNGRLEDAIWNGKENVVRLLLIMGADVEERGVNEMTPLLYAAYYGKLTFVKILVEAGADINARANTGGTVLYCAASKNDAELVQFLLENGARDLLDVSNDNGYTPLHIAAYFDKLPVAQLLVERGARLDLKNNNRQTPYQLAREKGSREIAKYLWSQLQPDEQARETSPERC